MGQVATQDNILKENGEVLVNNFTFPNYEAGYASGDYETNPIIRVDWEGNMFWELKLKDKE